MKKSICLLAVILSTVSIQAHAFTLEGFRSECGTPANIQNESSEQRANSRHTEDLLNALKPESTAQIVKIFTDSISDVSSCEVAIQKRVALEKIVSEAYLALEKLKTIK